MVGPAFLIGIVEMKTAYLNHPVTKDRKAEFRGKGFRILDAKFAPKKPEGGDHVDKKPAAKKPADK